MTTLYKTGTLSVGAGSTSVTGSGTAWTTSGTRPGDLLIAGGAVAEIASVNSATGITLANGWPAATQAAVNYAILQLDDGLRALIAANTLLQALDGGTLTSLAGLGGAANQLPYFTGEHVMGLTDFGAAARAFLAAGPVVTTNPADANTGRLLKTGDGGLLVDGSSGSVSLPPSNNLNALRTSGFFRYDDVTTGKPDPVAGVVLHFVRIGGEGVSRHFQLHISHGNTDQIMGLRSMTGDGSWSDWYQIWTGKNLIGSVSQSGGVPTGALIERGSNGNGSFVRFADGTQLCWRSIDDTTTAWSVAEGALFRRSSPVTWVYPAAFAGAPSVMATAHIGNEWIAGCRPRSVPEAGSVLLLPWSSSAPGSSTTKTIFATALGRWF
ncbi:hypothetical protein [Pararhodobacter marinus]|uniref:hypothetical protein n=1 Tax=Pararhodobacter marinus TaxID=2184063 RepID=UPI0035158382